MLDKLSIFFKYYLPALIWAGIIFYFSSIPSLRYSESATEEIILRKGAHFVEFSLLAFLLWRILFLGYGMKMRKAYWLTLILVGIYGISDEFHQTLVLGRTGKIIDATFDFFSVVVFLELILIYICKKIVWRNIFVLFISISILFGLGLKMIVDGASGERKPWTFVFKNEINKSKEYFIRIIFDTTIKRETIDFNNTTNKEENIKEDEKNNGEDVKIINDVKNEMDPEVIPKNIFIKVPFTSQAPFSEWDEIHEETCEEASIVMLEYYFTGKKLTKEIAEREIQALVKFQNKKFGDYKDTTAQQTIDLFLDYYGLPENGKKLKVVYDFDKIDLKKYLSLGNPIIIPAAGQELKNPNFTAPGPLYHNLVLVGFEGDTIITNDPGTRKGEGYKYDIDVLFNAIHDFPGKPEDIKKGRKAMIIVE